MEVNRVFLVSVCAMVILCLALVQAQGESGLYGETSDETLPAIGFGGRCQYTSECPTTIGSVCKYNTETQDSTCTCEDYHILSDDEMECLKDIGAPCTSHDECTLQFKYQNSRTCGASHLCVCTGNGYCGEGHELGASYDY